MTDRLVVCPNCAHEVYLYESECPNCPAKDLEIKGLNRTIDDANDAAIVANCCGSEFHNSPAYVIQHLSESRRRRGDSQRAAHRRVVAQNAKIEALKQINLEYAGEITGLRHDLEVVQAHYAPVAKALADLEEDVKFPIPIPEEDDSIFAALGMLANALHATQKERDDD